MRTTQFQGLTFSAIQFLHEQCITERIIPDYEKELSEDLEAFKKQYPSITSADLQTFILGYKASKEKQAIVIPASLDIGIVEGMFGEEIHKLKQYKIKQKVLIEEYVQAEPWSSGPCIFLALRNSETKEPILESLWNQDEIDNC